MRTRACEKRESGKQPLVLLDEQKGDADSKRVGS